MKSLFKDYKWRYVLTIEFVWWLIALLVSFAVLYPLISTLHFNFWLINGLFIFITVLLIRYVFFFYNIPWIKPMWVRFLLFAVLLNYCIFTLRKFQLFMDVFDSFILKDLGTPIHPISLATEGNLFNYFRLETTAIVTGSLVLSLALIVRLVSSYWKLAKRRMDDNFNI